MKGREGGKEGRRNGGRGWDRERVKGGPLGGAFRGCKREAGSGEIKKESMCSIF